MHKQIPKKWFRVHVNFIDATNTKCQEVKWFHSFQEKNKQTMENYAHTILFAVERISEMLECERKAGAHNISQNKVNRRTPNSN